MKERKDQAKFQEPCDVSRKLCKIYNHMQMEDFAVTKAVNVLRKVHENLKGDPENQQFFTHFIQLLKLPLSKGTSKDRMTTFDEKIFEVVCQFGTSFLKKEEDESMNSSKANDDDDALVELPPFLRDLFDWLLDHHEVESSGARLKGIENDTKCFRLQKEIYAVDKRFFNFQNDYICIRFS